MPVTPTGAPVWVRTTDFSHYGGSADKQNYQSQGAIDPLTDVTAEQLSRLAADVAAISRVSPFCVLTFLANDATASPPTVEVCNLMTGIRATSYTGNNPPSGFPSVTYASAGEHLITFASTYADAFGVSGGFVPKHATVGGHGVTGFDASVIVAGQIVYAYATSSGVGVTGKRLTVEVY